MEILLKITNYHNTENIEIKFEFSEIETHTTYRTLINNQVADPFYMQNGRHKPFIFINKKDDYLGRKYTNAQGEQYKIINYRKYSDTDAQFLTPPYYIREHVSIYKLEHGILNPYHKNVYGGFMGEDKTYVGKEYMFVKYVWYNILLRGANQDKMVEFWKKRNRVICEYRDTYVCEEWFNYSIFARDYMNKLSKLNPNIKYDIDKDLLFPFYKDKTNGMKCYSNETTVLLPLDINRSFLQLDPNSTFVQTRQMSNGKVYTFHLHKKIANVLQNLINWGSIFEDYLKIGAILPEIYEILENRRKENINIILETNPWYLNERES